MRQEIANQRAIIFDDTGDYLSLDIEFINEMMDSEHYEYRGYQRVNDIIHYYFRHKG